MIETLDTIPDRIARIRDKLNSPLIYDQAIRSEVTRRLQHINELYLKLNHGAETEIHPLGSDPVLTVDILFEIERCECLFNRSSRETVEYPTVFAGLSLTLFRRSLSVMLFLRGKFRGYPTYYDVPMLRETLYLRSPRWLAPLMKRILPNTRRKWIS